jgi:hypothetical protein
MLLRQELSEPAAYNSVLRAVAGVPPFLSTQDRLG